MTTVQWGATPAPILAEIPGNREVSGVATALLVAAGALLLLDLLGGG